MTDADFCSDEHRTKYHDLTRMALNRLVESHEQVAAPPRRKGKGQAAAVKEPPTPVIERLEPKAPEISERPAPPVPEKRPARPHRQQSPVIVPPPPRARPDPAMAGFAGLPSAVFSLESALRFAGDDEIRLPEIEIGRFSPETPALSLRVAEPVLPASAFARPLHGVARQAPPVLFELAPALTSSGRAQAPRSEVFQDPPPASYVDLAPPTPLHGSLALNSALMPAESRRPPLSLPGGPEQSHKHGFRVGGFDYSLPAPVASLPRQTPQSASGRATVRPSAMPRLDAVQCTGSLTGGAPRALAVPRPCALKPAPSIAGITLETPAVSLPVAEKMALATGLAASEPVARRPLPVTGPLPAATLATIAAPKTAAPPLCFPELPATPASHAVPLASALGLGMSPAPQAARPAATDAPLPLPSNILAGAIPIMLPPGTAAAATTGLPSGEAAATAVRAATPSDKPAHAGWAAFTFDPARTLAVIGTIDATRGLVAGALHIPGTPPPNAPAHCPAWRTEATFAVPETRRPQAPAKFHQRIPDTMPAIVTTPPQFAGTAPAPLGTTAALPGREPGLPALELSIPAALSLKHQDSRPPGIAKAPVSTVAPCIVTAPIRIEAVRPPPPLPGPAHTFTLASGGILPGPDPASARNVPLRPGAVAYVEFPSESASSRAQTQPLAGACKLAGGSAIAVAGRAPAGAAHPSPPESCGLAPQDAELPGPQSIAASLALPGALCLRLSSRALAGAPSRQPAGWESMQRERGTTGFASLASKFAIAIGATIAGGSLQAESAPPPLAGTPRPAAAPPVEIPTPATLQPESTGFAVSLRPVSVCGLGVHAMDDGRTAVKSVRLAPMFRAVRRPARLPVFGQARHGKAGMPAALFLSIEGHEDLDDYRTMRVAAGAGPCPVRMVMPASKRLGGIKGTLVSADLIAPAPAAVDRAPRASAFGYRVLPLRPKLPDGWVDTVPVEFERVAAEAAGQNWEPLVGAFKSASRFFKFM